ncbi:MAG TPA: hypothetical protein VNW46_03690 [Gemmatimonadaceae bacterium]|nr:hypothetical protein [Gemmatimonadaceae bacterium]
MFATRPPYALSAPPFRFPALAALAGRGQIGGDREVALAAFVAARLVVGVLPPNPLPAPARIARAAAGRHWLASLSLPPMVRAPFIRLVDATAGTDREALAAALRSAIDASSPALDLPARNELEAVLQGL